MKTDYMIKIIRDIFKIRKKIKIKSMSDNQNNDQQIKPTVINANTQIVFTFKGFISTILTILGIFFGFYKLVIQPDIEDVEIDVKEHFVTHTNYTEKEFNELKNSIKLNNQAIKANNDRFKDLNDSFQDIANSGGSFGNVSPTAMNSSDTTNSIP